MRQRVSHPRARLIPMRGRHFHLVGLGVGLIDVWLLTWVIFWVLAVPVAPALALARTVVWVLMGRPKVMPNSRSGSR